MEKNSILINIILKYYLLCYIRYYSFLYILLVENKQILLKSN